MFVRFKRNRCLTGGSCCSQSDDGPVGKWSFCRTTLDIRRDEGMEVMTLAGDTPGVCLPPWLPELSSCLCIVVIKGPRVYAIVWCLFCAVHSVRFCTLAVMIDVTAAEGSVIPMTMLLHLGVVDLSALGGCW